MIFTPYNLAFWNLFPLTINMGNVWDEYKRSQVKEGDGMTENTELLSSSEASSRDYTVVTLLFWVDSITCKKQMVKYTINSLIIIIYWYIIKLKS